MRSWGLLSNPVMDSALPLISWPWVKLICFLFGHMGLIQTDKSVWCVRCDQVQKAYDIR